MKILLRKLCLAEIFHFYEILAVRKFGAIRYTID